MGAKEQVVMLVGWMKDSSSALVCPEGDCEVWM
jgi:hypothetical protein